ncbi:uncharacterized protein TRIADDRAFT_54241 [Trichoplax adhaerens]|uniref:Protein cereblon n=1 Tax=Trichoplax adhaerens TaxID=10228 RepID=B3RRH7_TRIAD|nr:hypothetical protein TRIADDRAFT_54241 [Trichoplax adhaerens]EDV26878.1 hypothetical protein TRIADDRAFT_54241 [Trichoplax adhaerens]|eukprot:XP_002110874.1 hypothetical protein TRIADDRAFT_54241 [Trichoplax adhaerens]
MERMNEGYPGQTTNPKMYDKSLPGQHYYLSPYLNSDGDDTSSTGQRYRDGQVVELTLFALHNITLFPGQILPFRVAEFMNIDIEIDEFLSGEQSIGLVTCNHILDRQNDRHVDALSLYGVTADVQSFQIGSDRCLVGLLIGRQKFVTLQVSQVEGELFATGKVKILQDPQEPTANDHLAMANTILAQPRPNLSCWPIWVYRLYDKTTLRKKIKKQISGWFDNSHQIFQNNIGCDQFSINVASQLPVPILWRLNLLSMDDIINRLRTILGYLNRYSELCCQQCQAVITRYADVISMSSVGPLAIYVDSGGQQYETVTTSQVVNTSWSSEEATHQSWFPGIISTVLVDCVLNAPNMDTKDRLNVKTLQE